MQLSKTGLRTVHLIFGKRVARLVEGMLTACWRPPILTGCVRSADEECQQVRVTGRKWKALVNLVSQLNGSYRLLI